MSSSDRPQFRFLVGETLDGIRKRKVQPVDAIPTPLPTWNKLCGEEGAGAGLAKTWVVVLGGQPGSRKSYLSLNMAAHAVRQGRKVGAINFEMSMEGYATRFISVLTGTPKDLIGWGQQKFDQSAWEQAKEEADRLYQDEGGGLITNDATVFTLGHIEEAYTAFAKAGVDMVIVDYVQLVKAGNAGDLKERAGAVAECLRTNSHKHRMVTLALSQINRGGSQKSDQQPRMTDLYGGTYWEANANQVVLLDHTYEEKDRTHRCTRTKLLVDKNRHGENLVEVPIKWPWDTMRVEEDTDFEQELDDAIASAAPPGTVESSTQEDDDNEEDWWRDA